MKKDYKNLLALTIVLLVACGQNDNKQAVEKPPTQQEVEKTAPHTQQPKPIQVTENTRKTYQWYCAQCHGIEGKGNGLNAKLLTVPPRNHTKAEYLETRTDEQLFEAIKFGGLYMGRAPCMPAWGHTLDDSTMHSLVAYIRELCQCEAL